MIKGSAQRLLHQGLGVVDKIGASPDDACDFRLQKNLLVGTSLMVTVAAVIWGDAVNTASRMESHGIPGKIQITQEMYEILKDDFLCIPRGIVDVKGKGEMETWFLEGPSLE